MNPRLFASNSSSSSPLLSEAVDEILIPITLGLIPLAGICLMIWWWRKECRRNPRPADEYPAAEVKLDLKEAGVEIAYRRLT
jgi:hypothetical protein